MTRSTSSALAVKRITGMCLVLSSDLMSLHKVKPEPSGSIRSKIITSGLLSEIDFSPSAIEPA